jgi:hypothetical protein
LPAPAGAPQGRRPTDLLAGVADPNAVQRVHWADLGDEVVGVDEPTDLLEEQCAPTNWRPGIVLFVGGRGQQGEDKSRPVLDRFRE